MTAKELIALWERAQEGDATAKTLTDNPAFTRTLIDALRVVQRGIELSPAALHDEAPLPWQIGDDGDILDARGTYVLTIDQDRQRPDEICLELQRALVDAVNRLVAAP